jgi:hypothetical protein
MVIQPKMAKIKVYIYGKYLTYRPKIPEKSRIPATFHFAQHSYHTIGRGKRLVHNIAFIEIALVAT